MRSICGAADSFSNARYSRAPMDRKNLRAMAPADAGRAPLASVAVGILASRILFCSSMLFLLSLAYAIWLSVWDVVIGTAATAATSLLNHWFLSKHKFFNFLDKLVRHTFPLLHRSISQSLCRLCGALLHIS